MNILIIIIVLILIILALIAIPAAIYYCIHHFNHKEIEASENEIPEVAIDNARRSNYTGATRPGLFPDTFRPNAGYYPVILSSQSQNEDILAREQYEKKSALKLVEYRGIQSALIEQPYSLPTCSLLICVDANPRYIGGYCINFDTKICYTYTFPIEELPWELHDKSRKGDSAEFEMKNLMFALLLWEDQIKGCCREFRIYTDNSAIKFAKKNKYGERASNFIQHLRQCEGVMTNRNYDVHVNGELNPKEFAKYILPADDLSRWRIKECQEFLTNVHKIYKFQGTHIPKVLKKSSNSPDAKVWHDKTTHYRKFIDKVKGRLNYWRKNPCSQCRFMVGSTESLCPRMEE